MTLQDRSRRLGSAARQCSCDEFRGNTITDHPPDADNLSDSARSVLAAMSDGREVTRPELSHQLQVSKPTVSLAISELEATDLVQRSGSAQGQAGRSASVYRIGSRAGWVIGVDVGSSRFHLVARSLAGTVLHRADHLDPHAASLRRRAVEETRDCLNTFGPEAPLRAVCVAVPRTVPSDGVSTVDDPWRRGRRLPGLVDDLGISPATPVLVENNVNCAALAEHASGVARGVDDFAYLQIGLRIGAGIISDGRLLRGAFGAAGEIADLPFPFGPGSDHGVDALQTYLGSPELLKRARGNWSGRGGPTSTPRLFGLATEGDARALRAIDEHATDIANLATIVAAIVDPALIVLGGGVGQSPLLAPLVAQRIAPHLRRAEIKSSQLGDQVTVEGAVTIAAEHAMRTLLGRAAEHSILERGQR